MQLGNSLLAFAHFIFVLIFLVGYLHEFLLCFLLILFQLLTFIYIIKLYMSSLNCLSTDFIFSSKDYFSFYKFLFYLVALSFMLVCLAIYYSLRRIFTVNSFLNYESLWMWLIRLFTLYITKCIQLYGLFNLSPLWLSLVSTRSQISKPILANSRQVRVYWLYFRNYNLFLQLISVSVMNRYAKILV